MSFKVMNIAMLALAIAMTTSVSIAQQKPVAGRAGLDPASQSKIAVVQARARIEADGAQAAIEKSVISGPSGSSCTTNVGGNANSTASRTGDRYGPNKGADQIVVVKGPVINLCK